MARWVKYLSCDPYDLSLIYRTYTKMERKKQLYHMVTWPPHEAMACAHSQVDHRHVHTHTHTKNHKIFLIKKRN